jgi:predicted component of type VI protein secretion system
MNNATTAITVTSNKPPMQTDPDVPFQAIIADMTGHRPSPGEVDDEQSGIEAIAESESGNAESKNGSAGAGAEEEDAVDDFAEDDAKRFECVDVTPLNYDKVLRSVWKPRFKGKVPDLLTGRSDRELNVDISLQSRTKFWAGELDSIPEIKAVLALIQKIERLQTALSRQPALRDRLSRLIVQAISGETVANALEAPVTNN